MNMISILKLALVASFLVGLEVTDGAHWALLVAGSNGYYNYRHQADICHAYQILHKNGIPDENIVVMMFDDIANNRRNKKPGTIINKPGGSDVYHNVPKDYTGMDVTPENFLNILKGNKSGMAGIGSGKVINSGPDDYVFVNFADHGAPNLIAFPRGELHAKDLIATINYMNTTKRYKEMVFYVEACESGSMFNRHKLSKNINVFATTAANGKESSYACYWDKELHTYLGDVYSIKWMEDSDSENIQTETLQKQFQIVREETNTSHVQEFGDLTMGKEKVGRYQSNADNSNMFRKLNVGKKYNPIQITDAIPSPDVPLMTLRKRLETTTDVMEREEIMIEIRLEEESRKKIKSTIEKIAGSLVPVPRFLKSILETPAEPIMEDCYKEAVTTFRNYCFDYNKHEHALRHVYVLANLCDQGFQTERIVRTIRDVCFSGNDSIQVIDA